MGWPTSKRKYFPVKEAAESGLRCLAGGIKSVIKYRPDTICLSPEMRSRWGSSSWGGWWKVGLLTGWVTANSIYPSRSWFTLGGTARLVLLKV